MSLLDNAKVKEEPISHKLKLFGLTIGEWRSWQEIDVDSMQYDGVKLNDLGYMIFPQFPPVAEGRDVALHVDIAEGNFAFTYSGLYGVPDENYILPMVPLRVNWFAIAKQWDTFYNELWAEYQRELADAVEDIPALAGQPQVRAFLDQGKPAAPMVQLPKVGG